MSKLLFVVHRYWPYEGGSERNVKHMAEECLRRGHEVTVLTDEHHGDQNGIKVTSDRHVLTYIWDLIIVHGSCPTQDIVLANAHIIPSPIVYMIIQPRHTHVIDHGLRYSDYVAYGTSFDYQLIQEVGIDKKARKIDYGIPESYEVTPNNFKSKLKLTDNDKIILSVGGWWPHKKMDELIDAFKEANLPDNVKLVLTGYDSRFGARPTNGNKNTYLIENATHDDIMQLMAESNLYVMNSNDEGFGLVLLESMINKCPWIARDIAGAHDMQAYGKVYNTKEELITLLQTYTPDKDFIDLGYRYVKNSRLITHMVDDIIAILKESGERREWNPQIIG